MTKLHSQSIPAETISQVQTKIDEAYALLMPYVISLTTTQRMELPKMGSKTLSFVETASQLAKQNPNLCPAFLDLAAFDIDLADAVGLRVLHNSTSQLLESMDDTALAAGSEAYQQALIFYNSVKYAASQNVPGANPVYEALKYRFSRGSSKAESSS